VTHPDRAALAAIGATTAMRVAADLPA